MMPSFLQPTTPLAFTRIGPTYNQTSPAAAGGASSSSYMLGAAATSSRTTLSQRFRKAIQQGDLELAQRIAARAFELQLHRRPSAYKALEPAGITSPQPPKAALRAALAQRPNSLQPFDVRNLDPTAPSNKATRHHHRKYTLGIPESSSTEDSLCAESSLIIAIKSNADVELIRWLIEMGHEQRGPSLDSDGHTVLHLAALYDRSDIIYAYSTYNSTHVASSISDLIDAENLHERRTALQLACIKGFDDVARQLLDLGADVDLQDRAGNTALHFAAAWGHLPLVQLLIERGCSFAVQNAEGSTASDYAFSYSIKAALEAFARARFESRKKNRRPPIPVVGAQGSAPRGSFDDRDAVRTSRNKASSSLLSRSGSHDPLARSASTTPLGSTSIYDDWDPEKTFAQPGQDLLPGTRGSLSSPPAHQHASSPSARPSIDLYSEVLNRSPRSMAGLSNSQQDSWHNTRDGLVAPLARTAAQSQSEAGMRPQLSPFFGHIRRTPSPGFSQSSQLNASSQVADRVRMQDAAAMSLFRSTTPQPGLVPGRIDSPPIMIPHRTSSPFSLHGRPTKPDRSPRNATAALLSSSLPNRRGSPAVGSKDLPHTPVQPSNSPQPPPAGDTDRHEDRVEEVATSSLPTS